MSSTLARAATGSSERSEIPASDIKERRFRIRFALLRSQLYAFGVDEGEAREGRAAARMGGKGKDGGG